LEEEFEECFGDFSSLQIQPLTGFLRHQFISFRYIVRDADSRLSLREKFALDEWIASGKGVHSIRDHPHHDNPFLGGLWGATKGSVPNLVELSRNWNRNEYIQDMNLLNHVVYPKVKDNMMSHDSHSCIKWGGRPFPTRRFGKEIVGGVYGPDDIQRAGDVASLTPAPPACRKEPDWNYG
jgi:hypothetical protein